METAHPLRDMSAEISTTDDAGCRHPVDAVQLTTKFRLPTFPPGRADTDVKAWYRATVGMMKQHRLAHILRTCEKDLNSMNDKEFSNNALVSQALYDCLSSNGQRRRLREKLGGDAEDACAALFELR